MTTLILLMQATFLNVRPQKSHFLKVLTSNDDFRYTYKTTKFRKQDQEIMVETTHVQVVHIH